MVIIWEYRNTSWYVCNFRFLHRMWTWSDGLNRKYISLTEGEKKLISIESQFWCIFVADLPNTNFLNLKTMLVPFESGMNFFSYHRLLCNLLSDIRVSCTTGIRFCISSTCHIDVGFQQISCFIMSIRKLFLWFLDLNIEETFQSRYQFSYLKQLTYRQHHKRYVHLCQKLDCSNSA
jgi:hypothetical protein